MREQLYALLELQEIDLEILHEEKKQKRLPDSINEIEKVIENIEKRYLKEKESLKELQMKIKRREIDSKTIDAKIIKHQDELYSGKTSDIKELKQLQKVIESMKNDRDKIEEDLLIMMDEEDGYKEGIGKIEKELSQIKEQLKKRNLEVSQEEKEIQLRIQERNKKREEIISKITNHELLESYRMLWKEKEGKVVVEIDGPTCSGCNLSLPSDIIYHLQKDDLLITCPNCNRILVWKRSDH
ncbi:MAG: hypothetical protein JXC36_07710 [Candidatus Atribacteria bacterium]|nr:hypothetical protein [Candidatus Atribacteria bacterium]